MLRHGRVTRAVRSAVQAAVAAGALAGLAPMAAAVELPFALESALAVDHGVVAARLARDAAQQGIEVARGRYWPQITLQSTNQELEQTTTSGTGNTLFNGRSMNTQLQVRQGVYRPRDRLAVEISNLQAEQAEARVQVAQADVFNRTAAAWIDVLGARALRQAYQRLADSAQGIAEQARQRFAAGDGTKDAVAEAEAQLMSAKAQVMEAELDLGAKRHTFAQITRLEQAGFDGFELPAVAELADIPEADDQLLGRVLAGNAEITAQRLDARISERRLAVAGTDHLPTLDLIGGRAQARNDTTNTLGLRYSNYSFGVQLVVPIFSGGSASAAERQAAATVLAAQATVDALGQRLRSQFVTDWLAQQGLRQRAQATLGLIESAREQRRAVAAHVAAGSKTLADLSTADQLIARREADLVAVQVLQVKAQARVLALLPAQDDAQRRWAMALSGRARN